ncbi:hypothetical protein DV737_g2987, partial [Chaetothyriales sp. CBS 132003]
MHHFSSAALVAGLLLAPVSSFLIPPPVPDSPPHTFGLSSSIISELDCFSCPFAGTDASEAWQDNVDSKIYLQFDASVAGGLTVNGLPLVSSLFDAPLPFPPTALQVRTSDGAVTRPLDLGFILVRSEPVFDPDTPDQVLLPIQFTIIALDGKPVKVDTIAIDLIKTRDRLVIARLVYIPFETTPGARTCGDASGWSLCRAKAFISSRLQQMAAAARHHGSRLGLPRGGCHGRKHGAPDTIAPLDEQGLLQPPPHRHRKHHHHHGRLHRFGKLVHHAMRYFFIPATLGIIGGLVASAVGMLIAQFVLYLWQAFFRPSTRLEEPSEAQVLAVDEEKMHLMEEEKMEEDGKASQYHDEPPRYKDVESLTPEAKN